MENPLARMQQRILEAIQQEMGTLIEALLKDAFQPEKFRGCIEAIGLDLLQLSRMVGQQTGLDPYRVLGLENTANDEEVKKRYRELLIKLHPDTAGVLGTDFLLQMIIAAYQQIAKERGW